MPEMLSALIAHEEWWTYRKDLSTEAKKSILPLVPKAKDVHEKYTYCLCAGCKRYYMKMGDAVVSVECIAARVTHGNGTLVSAVSGGT